MKLKKEKNIFFTPIQPVDPLFYPSPAIKNIPDWYKKTTSFVDDGKIKINRGVPNLTIKKCIPFFDAMTTGYILFTHMDVYAYFDERGSHFSSPQNDNAVGVLDFHPNDQAKNYPNNNMMNYPKWINPWSITTPRGYSTLFVPPMHNPNGFFNIISGIVDTDTYHNPVNLPFILNNPTFEGIIPAGTPICQVIPFKRDNFKMNIKQDKKSIDSIFNFNQKYSIKFFNNYKSRFWEKKNYR